MGFTRNDVEALSASLAEPDWVTQRRLEAWSWFEKMEVPGEKEEPWRYTNLARLKFDLEEFGQASPPNQGEVVAGADAGEGVIVTDIHTAINEHTDLIRPHLFSQFNAGNHLFSALHGALFSGGTFVYVPRGVTVLLPVTYECRLDQPGSSVFPHTLVVAEENSQVCYLERFWSSGLSGPALSNPAIEVVAAQASRVFVATIQEYEKQVWHFQSQRNRTGRDAHFKSLVVTLGGKLSRTEVSTEIGGEGNSVDMMGIYLAGAGQHFDFRTLQDHAAPHSTSDLLYKGALRDNARTVYSGQIRVRPAGRETDAYQTNRNLVLSDNALANSKPELEIENNDVRCSHAASVGQIDEAEIFYLQSRGIERRAAERLIAKGFLEEVLGKVDRDDIREMVVQRLDDRLSVE